MFGTMWLFISDINNQVKSLFTKFIMLLLVLADMKNGFMGDYRYQPL